MIYTIDVYVAGVQFGGVQTEDTYGKLLQAGRRELHSPWKPTVHLSPPCLSLQSPFFLFATSAIFNRASFEGFAPPATSFLEPFDFLQERLPDAGMVK